MKCTWSEDLATGNMAVDAQHKQLIAAFNDLLDACASGHGRAHLSSTLKFLMDYTAKHFVDEEKLQQKYNYPDYQYHKKLHEDFKIIVLNLEKQLEEKGPTVTLVSEVNTKIGGWLLNHIKIEDKKVAAYIHR